MLSKQVRKKARSDREGASSIEKGPSVNILEEDTTQVT